MTRTELRDVLQKHLSQSDDVLAMWEAGSHAFDRADQWSDLDIGLLGKAGSLQRIWPFVEHGLDEAGGITTRWENPQHVFKGMTQRVYRLKSAAPWLQLDIGIFEETAEDLYLQPQRHGRATILFDRTPTQRTHNDAPFDPAAHAKRMREALHQELIRWDLYHGFIVKELNRGRTADAFGFYIAFAIRPLLTVLGMLHRPERFDYGFRYVKEELPTDVFARLERLMYVPEPAALRDRLSQADSWFREIVGALRQRGIEPLDLKQVDQLSVDDLLTARPSGST